MDLDQAEMLAVLPIVDELTTEIALVDKPFAARLCYFWAVYR